VNSGLTAAVENQSLEVVDDRIVNSLNDLGCFVMKPFHVRLLEIEALP